MKILLVTGSRGGLSLDEMDFIARELATFFPRLAKALMHGGAPGVDTFSDVWALNRGFNRIICPYVSLQGPSGGPIRNQLMVERIKPDFVLAFPRGESRGTRGTMALARKAGIPVYSYELDVA